jgi:DNA polymerase delta subunit 1
MPPRSAAAATPAKRKAPPRPHVSPEYEAPGERAPAEARPVAGLLPPRAPPPARGPADELFFMVLDITEEPGGRFYVWGATAAGASVLVRVEDFEPYFYVAAPRRAAGGAAIDWAAPGECAAVAAALNRGAPADGRVARVEPVRRRPLMFFHPAAPGGNTFLRCALRVGGSARRAGAAAARLVAGGGGAPYGLAWRDPTLYEADVAPLQRFFVDAGLAGGAWVRVPAAAAGAPGHAPPAARASRCNIEVAAPWRALACLSPDAVQLADAGWRPPGAEAASPAAAAAAAAARRGEIAPLLRTIVLDVVAATRDGAERAPVPGEGDPVVAVTCVMFTGAAASDAAAAAEAGEEADAAGDGFGEEEEDVGGGGAAAAPTSAPRRRPPAAATFVVLALAPAAAAAAPELRERGAGARVLLFAREAELLLTFAALVRAYDPDVLATYQVNDTLGAIARRCDALGLGAALDAALARSGGAAGAPAKPLALRRVAMYSASWVRSQSRMAATSNMETWRADAHGRVVVDALRAILTASSLASFSLADCVQTLLGETIEVLGAGAAAALAGVAPGGGGDAGAGAARALRLARYSARRAEAISSLLQRTAVLPEAIEMSRACGLTLGQVAYNAQMVRAHSLVLRAARRHGYIAGGRREAEKLSESPCLIHPVEEGTVGLYRDQPVAILDFAALYPSLFIRHNMCVSLHGA